MPLDYFTHIWNTFEISFNFIAWVELSEFCILFMLFPNGRVTMRLNGMALDIVCPTGLWLHRRITEVKLVTVNKNNHHPEFLHTDMATVDSEHTDFQYS